MTDKYKALRKLLDGSEEISGLLRGYLVALLSDLDAANARAEKAERDLDELKKAYDSAVRQRAEFRDALRKAETQITSANHHIESVSAERERFAAQRDDVQTQLSAAIERAEKAERERDESAKGLSILRECTVAERDRIYGYEMAKLRAELARMTADRDSHCEHANQESSRASDYAEANETLRTRVAALESEVKRLRDAMPTREERAAILAMSEEPTPAADRTMLAWLTRLDAARGGAK